MPVDGLVDVAPGVTDHDAAFGRQLLHIAVGQSVAQVPAHGTTITSAED